MSLSFASSPRLATRLQGPEARKKQARKAAPPMPFPRWCPHPPPPQGLLLGCRGQRLEKSRREMWPHLCLQRSCPPPRRLLLGCRQGGSKKAGEISGQVCETHSLNSRPTHAVVELMQAANESLALMRVAAFPSTAEGLATPLQCFPGPSSLPALHILCLLQTTNEALVPIRRQSFWIVFPMGASRHAADSNRKSSFVASWSLVCCRQPTRPYRLYADSRFG